MDHPISTAVTGDSRPVILIVDDTPDNISLLSGLLKEQYKVRIATSGVKALQIASQEPHPDLILLDVMMPEMDGYETCRRLKSDLMTADIPVIFLTARSQVKDEELGLRLGAVDYIGKPISPAIVQARVATQLNLIRARQLLRNQNVYLERLVEERTEELGRLQDAIIMAMALLGEARDNETANHIRRTQAYVALLARQLSQHPRFCHELSEANITLLYKSAPLHDIGKIGIPDSVLLKEGKLTPEEFDLMKQHTWHGRETILSVEKYLGGSNEFLRFAREITYSHQEKWDGTGYPEGLRGEQIPVSARIMAVADAYDALISERDYDGTYTHAEAIVQIHKARGLHFDPDVVDAFLVVADDFAEIAKTHRDSQPD
ncbi:response regulator [Undibacterium oligocarboniphilum]|uniref:Two-component system response regulator n=1 Tax=Undibacterium oligocarboniphilum TaxID=666702 RepID=A0A850Q970_9BURK|nr:two-component system response regulator [Undibacterium oligocarboniphilum]MBC3868862.1 two-component system response regulator [Undibacterium oligocarboniphilum]NVO76842.1 two-component system response regulator [Undibacterium oligocarboniphilum]